MNSELNEFLFVEKYRPRNINDCVLPETIKDMFQEIIDGGSDNFPNMIFSGGPGIGKTTVARALCEELDIDYLFVNASDENGIDVLRTKIRSFASTYSLTGGIKVVILDEADHLNPSSTQPALRGFMEEFSKNCRFILTCNYKNKIIPALHSRCPVVEFKIPKAEKANLAGEMFVRVSKILHEEEIAFKEEILAQAITQFFPDFRMILGKVQQFSHSKTLDPDILKATGTESFDTLFTILKNKKFNDLRKWVGENSDTDIQSFYSEFYKYVFKMYDAETPVVEKESMGLLIPLIQQYAYESSFTADSEINMMAFLTMVMVETKVI